MTGKLGFYLAGFTAAEARQLRADLAEIARQHGYIARRGPTSGDGNVAELLVAIASGEVALLLLADEEQWKAIEYLDAETERLRQSDYTTAEALRVVSDALKDAQKRAAAQERMGRGIGAILTHMAERRKSG